MLFKNLYRFKFVIFIVCLVLGISFNFSYHQNQTDIVLADDRALSNNIEEETKVCELTNVINEYQTGVTETTNNTTETQTTSSEKIAENVKNSVNQYLEQLKTMKEQQEQERLNAIKQAEEEKAAKTSSKNAQSLVKTGNIISMNDSDRNLFERVVEAEAGGESFQGKLAVATVVANRLESGNYSGVSGVVYASGQFSIVTDGKIDAVTPSSETIQAVSKVVDEGYRSFGSNVLYFCNPNLSTNTWMMNNKELVIPIGNHNFYK